MRTVNSLALLLVLLPLTASAQNLYPKKDLAFAQIAAGGAYETVLNITNRGPNTYNGTLNLRTQTGLAWNPFVNGNQITGGRLTITINGGATATYRITRNGGTEAGYAIIAASDLTLSSFLEGTLTYYVRSGAVLVDSVGVQPASEVYLTAVPFDDFSRLAIALANANESGVTVKLSVFSETNARVATLDVPFAPGEHKAVYLWQLFSNLQITRGRLEIQSDPPVFGTMLTDINAQLSSLPFLPAVKAYTFTGSIGGTSYTGEISLWFDGPFLQGYLRLATVDGVPDPSPDTFPLTGTLANGVLQIITCGDPTDTTGDELLVHMIIPSYSLSSATLQVSAIGWWLDTHNLEGTGSLTFTAIN